MKKRVEDYGAYQEEISIPPLPPPVLSAAEKKDLTFSMSFLIRMLYSCLVDADYLNTEDFMKDGETSRITGETIQVLLEKLNRHIARWLVNDDQDTINGRRTEILKSCIEKGKKKKGLFRPVSYTHLDVYKRQTMPFSGKWVDKRGCFTRIIKFFLE